MADIKTILLDGDEYVYVACSAVEYEMAWDEQNVLLASNVEQAWDAFQAKLLSVQNAIGGQCVTHVAFGNGSFRRSLYPDYKKNRGKRPPLCFDRLVERVQENYPTDRYTGLEGDDLLGIWSTSGQFENPIIVSQDKDMLTVPGTLFREGVVMYVSSGDADYYWMKQTLTGDTSDGYPGCPGVGPVGAEKLLNEFVVPEGGFRTQDAWQAVLRTYDAKGLTYDDALTQARLARILRATDWDYEKREVKLWEPGGIDG